MNKHIGLVLSCLLCSTAGCALAHRYGPYQGKVVDAETKETLEGVAILAVFNTQSYGPGGSTSHYVEVQEAITDRNGDFYIPSFTSYAFRPLQSYEPYAWFWIFTPEYGCYPNHIKAKPMFLPNGSLPSNKQIFIELPRVKTKEERLENLRCEPVGIPSALYPRYLHSINKERTSLDLDIVPIN